MLSNDVHSQTSFFFSLPISCEINRSRSAHCFLSILHWQEDRLEILFSDNYDHIQPWCDPREANVKEQAVVSPCGVTLIVVTHDTVERAKTPELWNLAALCPSAKREHIPKGTVYMM